MEHLFFDLNEDLDTVSVAVFKALGIEAPENGDSVNVYGGTYADYSLFGLSIRLEENSYDYEEEFRFMMSVKRNPLSEVVVSDEIIKKMAEVTKDLLVLNLRIPVAMEKGSEIELSSPES